MKKQLKKIFITFVLSLLTVIVYAQYEIKPREGYTPQIGIIVDMLEELKDRLTEDLEGLSQEEIDYLFDDKANSVAAILMHIIANEVYYQTETLEGRPMTEEEVEFWKFAGNLSDESREHIKGKPISYYLGLWEEVRAKTLAGLKSKDDEWLASIIEEGINNHWVWFHVIEHQAAHMGQIAIVKNRFNK